MFEKQIGIDLGTVNVLVYVCGRGVVLQEPSVVAISVRDNKIVAVGSQAKDMLGRAPADIEVARPVRDGVIADYMVTEHMLRYFIRRVIGRNPMLRPQVMISAPKGVTSVEQRAVYDAALRAGAKEAFLIDEPLAAALGAGLPIHRPVGNMVVNIGGGTTEAAVISLNGIDASDSIRVAGDRIDQAIIAYVRKKYNLRIGEPTAESLKVQIGSATQLEDELTMEVSGLDQVSGLPRTINVTSTEITEAMEEPLNAIVDSVRRTLERTKPELASDVLHNGVVLAGGSAQLRNVEKMITLRTDLPCFVAENPIACVSIGAGKALENVEVMRRFLPQV